MDKIKPIILPKDNGPHDFVVEWWYFNGHLHDFEGKEYAFMDCFFKVNLSRVNIPYILPHLIEDYLKRGEYFHFAHSIVVDISNKKTYKEIQNVSLVSEDTFKKELLFIKYKNSPILGDHFNSEIIENMPNNFHIQNKDLNLELASKKSPLLEGGHGYVGTSEMGSYYYSFTDLFAKGKINIEGKEIKVEGRAWMDHQWANTAYRKDKWIWFSFCLENGTEIMCVKYEAKIGIDILINTIDKNGNQKQYKKANIKPKKKFWKSKKTKAKYPLSWTIEIPEAKIIIKTISLIKDQEIIFGQINYWEGPVKVIAKIDGKKVNGKGFMELVGYPSDYNYLLLVGGEIEDKLFSKIKNLFKIHKKVL